MLHADGKIAICSRASGLEFRERISRAREGGVITRGSAAANTRTDLRWQILLARQTPQTLLRALNSFPKQGASENLGSRIAFSLTHVEPNAGYGFKTFVFHNVAIPAPAGNASRIIGSAG